MLGYRPADRDKAFLRQITLVMGQRKLRAFIREYNERTGATVLLTSHYMPDVQALCKRVVVIHHGRILFDGDLSSLIERFTAYKTVTVKLAEMKDTYDGFGKEIARTDDSINPCWH